MNVEIEVETSFGVAQTIHYREVKEVKRGNSHFTIFFEDGRIISHRNNLVRSIEYHESPKEPKLDYEKMVKESIQIIKDKRWTNPQYCLNEICCILREE